MLKFEDALEPMAVIRTTFETLECFPDDPQMRPELQEIIEEHRFQLGEWFYAFTWEVDAHPDALEVNWQSLRDTILAMTERGLPGDVVNRYLRGNWFDEAPWKLPLPADIEASEAAQMDGHRFTVVLLRDLYEKSTDRANMVDQRTFERVIFLPYMALVVAYYASTDPLRYL